MKTTNIILATALYAVTCFWLLNIAKAQNIGINTTGAPANASAMLDVDATNKGMLIPRVSLTSVTDVTTIATPANGLIVYNTNAAMTNGNGVGLYYYCSIGCATTGWKFMAAADNGPGNVNEVLTSQGAGAQTKWAVPVVQSGGGGATGCASCISAISTYEGTNINWSACREACRTLVEGGFSDWRMPTWDEAIYYASGVFNPPDGTWAGYVWTSTPLDARVGPYTTGQWLRLSELNGDWIPAPISAGSSCRCVR